MALKLIANYSKRLGLPGYSSHQFAVTVETEISNINDGASESTRLYQTLQQSVDDEIQHTGFVPDEGYGISEQGARNGHRSNGANGNGHTNGEAWACSDKQRELIVKLVEEHKSIARRASLVAISIARAMTVRPAKGSVSPANHRLK